MARMDVYITKCIGSRKDREMSIERQFEQIGRMIAAEGLPEFPRCLADFLRSIAHHDFTVIFGYRGTARPLDLYDDFPRSKHAVFVTDYQAGP